MNSIRDLKLVSLHILKTAGNSFRMTFSEIFYDHLLCRINIKPDESIINFDGTASITFQIPRKARIVHGHFVPKNLYHNFPKLKSLPIITWVRNPIDRILSNYYYVNKQMLNSAQNNVDLMSMVERMTKSLDEYISDKNNQNRMHKFIEGLQLEYFKFVGIVEDYKAEMNYATKLFSWGNIRSFSQNKTNIKMEEINIEKIQELNQEDFKIYEKALAMKMEQIKL